MFLKMDKSVVLFISRTLFRLFFIVSAIHRLGFGEILKCEDIETSHYKCNWICGKVEINLNKLLQNFPKKPVFDFQKASGGDDYSYSYEPCVPYTIPGCKNVAVCQASAANVYYDVGAWDKAVTKWNTTSQELQITYNSSDGNRNSVVTVKCASGVAGKLTRLGERKDKKKTYDFTLETDLVCQGGGGGGGLSPGSILLIVFFVLLIVYFVVGFLILWFARGARGTEAIPNYDFWCDLPSLVKDGVVFTTSCCKTERTYSQI